MFMKELSERRRLALMTLAPVLVRAGGRAEAEERLMLERMETEAELAAPEASELSYEHAIDSFEAGPQSDLPSLS